MRLYLDTCALLRPFDDQRAERIRRETNALITVLGRIDAGEWKLVTSDVLEEEVLRIRDPEKVQAMGAVLRVSERRVELDDAIGRRARELAEDGMGGFDALHLAAATAGRADVLLTVDDRFIYIA